MATDDKNQDNQGDAIAKALREQEKQEQSINDRLKERLETSRKISEEAKDAADATKKTEEYLNSSAKNYTDIDKKIENITNNYDKIVDAEQILEETKAERIKALEEEYKINQKDYLLLLERIKEEKNQDPLTQARLEAQRKALEEKIKSQAQELKDDKEIRKGKEEILSIWREMKSQAWQYGQQLEKHIMQISVATGGFAAYNSSIREAGRLSQAATLGTGITGEENQKALEGLSQGFIGLATYSSQSISAMQQATAQLSKFGVNASVAAKSFDSLVNAMGKTPQQAVKIQDSFVQMAAKNNLALGSVTQAFAENSSRFVSYGEQMTKVMAGLAEQSNKTGVAINSLINIAQGFDTFEDASRKVGSLNALLGGDYFNSIEMLTASDEERIRLLKEGVKASGMQWESLNRQQKQAIASAAGIRDLNEAAKMFGETSLSNTKQQREAADVQKTLAEQAESVSLGMDKLKSAFNGLFIAVEPFVSVFMTIVELFSKGVQIANSFFSETLGMGKEWGAVTTSIVVGVLYSFTRLGGAIRMIGSLVGGVVSKLFSFGSSLIKTGAQTQTASGGIANAIRTIGMAGMQASFGLLAIGAALFMIGAGIGLAALGFSKLVESFAKLTGPQAAAAFLSIVAIMGGFVWMLSILTTIAFPASISIKVLSAAFFGLGISLVLVGAIIIAMSLAFGYMASSIASLFTAMKGMKAEDVTKLFKSIFSELTIANISSLYDLSDSLETVVGSLNRMLSFTSQLTKFIELLSKLGDISAKIDANLTKTYTESSNVTQSVVVENPGMSEISTTGQSSLIPASATKETSAGAKGAGSLIPAQQTVAYVPLVVEIDKTKIIRILKQDIANISSEIVEAKLETMGLTQSAFYVQNRVGSETSTG